MSQSGGNADGEDDDKKKSLEEQISALNDKVSKLVDTISQLNTTILSLQSEKSDLINKIKNLEDKNCYPNGEKKRVRKKKKKNKRSEPNKQNSAKTSESATKDKQERDECMNQSFVSMHSVDILADSISEQQHTTKANTQPTTSNNTNTNTNEERPNTVESSESSDGVGDSDSDSSSSSYDSDDDEKEEKNETAENNTNTIKRSNKIPPVDVWSTNRAEVQRLILSKLPPSSCLFGRINNGKFRIFPRDCQTRQIVIGFLTKRKYQFNTYTPIDEKMINVIIKGLDHIDDPDTVKENLAEHGFVPNKIQKHVTGYMRKNDVKSNLWHIVLQPNTDIKALFAIRVIDNAIVKFEFLKKPKVIQCKRCQRLYHSASNCSLPYRCVKCTKNHEPGQCGSNTDTNKFTPQCVNCNGKHTANDMQKCPFLQKALNNKEQNSKKKSSKSEKKTSSNSQIQSGTSFADIVKKKKSNESIVKQQQSNKQLSIIFITTATNDVRFHGNNATNANEFHNHI